jgi:hypothetical protein
VARPAVGFPRLDGAAVDGWPRTTGRVGAVGEGWHITLASFAVIEGWGTAAVARPPWPGQGQPFTGEVAADGGWYAWRLSSANHRELGRGIAVHASLESVLGSLLHLRANAPRAVISYSIAPSGGLWTWRLSIDALATATSSRAYHRQREAAYAAAAFTAAVRIAVIPTVACRRHRSAQMNNRRTPNGEAAYGPSAPFETLLSPPSVGLSQPPS